MSFQNQSPCEKMDFPYSYPDSVSSSPRSVGRASRGTVDSEYSTQQQHRWDQDQESSRGGSVRFMCSYGGRILPRPHDNQLRYVGGDTRIVAVARNISYSLLISKLSRLCGSAVTLKYQLPNEDLDALISVTTDEDLENMMEEYDRLQLVAAVINNSKPSSSSSSSSRLRLFLFPAKPESAANSLGSLLEGSKREGWFVDALNGVSVLTRGRSEVSSLGSENPDYLFGLDTIEDTDCMANQNQNQNQPQPQPQPARKSRMFVRHGEELNPRTDEEVHSTPVSPMPDSSPYCSTSSAPPCLDSYITPVEPQQAGAIEMNDEGLDPLTSEGIPDHETQAALESPGLQTQDFRLVLETEISLAEAFQQIQISKEEKNAGEGSQSQPDFEGPMKREGSVSNLSDDTRYLQNTTGGQQRVQQESNYPDDTPAFTMMLQQQQIPAEHYMEQSHPCPQPYWQVHDPHSHQAIPFYLPPTRSVPSAVHPTGHPAGMPFQQMGTLVPITAPAVYNAEMLTSRSGIPTGAMIQMTRNVVTTQSPSYAAHPTAASKVPLHRARSVVTDSRINLMRPSQPPVIYLPPDQYGYQQVVYETNPAPNVYYNQKAAVMMPHYQTMAPVTTDLQTSSQAVPKIPRLARVGQSL